MITPSSSLRNVLLTVLLVVPLLSLLAAPALSVAQGSRGEEETIAAAAEEAATWPDYNPSDLANQALQSDAAEEAAGWPNFDSTSLGDQVFRVEQASAEAAGWPNLDPSNITVSAPHAPMPNGPHDHAY